MRLVKCPRCDLNYITEDQKVCKVCLREMKGESHTEETELCSICGEAPCLPGRDVCAYCLKEMSKSNSGEPDDQDLNRRDDVDTDALGDMDDVNSMDEMLPEVEQEDGIPDSEYGEMEKALSLENVREDEEREAEEADAEKEEI